MGHSVTEWGSVADAAMDGIGMLDGDGFITANEPFVDQYGYDERDLLGVSWRDLYGSEGAGRLDREVRPRVERGGFWEGTATVRHAGIAWLRRRRHATAGRRDTGDHT